MINSNASHCDISQKSYKIFPCFIGCAFSVFLVTMGQIPKTMKKEQPNSDDISQCHD